MHGPRRKRGVCLYKLISQTKRVSRPPSCFGSKQAAGRPPSTWQNKMGRWRDSEYNISANKRAVYWDDTSERPTLCCLSCKFGQSSVGERGASRSKKTNEIELQLGSDWNMGSDGGYKNPDAIFSVGESWAETKCLHLLFSLLSVCLFEYTHKAGVMIAHKSIFQGDILVSVCPRWVPIKPCFLIACECISIVAVTPCRSQSDTINPPSLGLNDIISYAGKQVRNGTRENRGVHWHDEKGKPGRVYLTASHMLIWMTGLPGTQVRRSRG